MSTEADSNLPAWISAFVAAVVGLFVGATTMIKLAFNFNSRLQAVEAKDIGAVVREELEHERHNVLYPTLQIRVYAPLDKIEEEVKMQGQNIAVLLERDRASAAMERMADAIAARVGEAVTSALKNHRQ